MKMFIDSTSNVARGIRPVQYIILIGLRKIVQSLQILHEENKPGKTVRKYPKRFREHLEIQVFKYGTWFVVTSCNFSHASIMLCKTSERRDFMKFP